MNKKFIWFDLGYTLVFTNREEVYQEVLRSFRVNKSMDEIKMAYHLADKLFMREFKGVLGKDSRIFFPWYIGTLNFYLNLPLSIEEVVSEIKRLKQDRLVKWQAFDFTKSTLLTLKELGYSVGLISNWNHTAREVLEDNHLLSLFDEVVISSEVGIEKPNPEIFKLALLKGKVSASESLYVGDNYYDDVIGSKALGMDCLLINPFGKTGIEEITYDQVISTIQEVPVFLGHSRIEQGIS